MKAALQTLVLAALFGAATVAQAQPYGDPQPAPLPRPADPADDWTDQRFERQSFREEMEEIRRDHEELEREQDRIDTGCGPRTQAQTLACDMARESLQQRRMALRARRMSLRDRMAEARQQRPADPQTLWPPAGSPAMLPAAGPP